MKIIPNVLACTGCRICELECSFYHNVSFSPESSFIKVTLNNVTGDIDIDLDSGCDKCLKCVNACHFSALEVVK